MKISKLFVLFFLTLSSFTHASIDGAKPTSGQFICETYEGPADPKNINVVIDTKTLEMVVKYQRIGASFQISGSSTEFKKPILGGYQWTYIMANWLLTFNSTGETEVVYVHGMDPGQAFSHWCKRKD